MTIDWSSKLPVMDGCFLNLVYNDETSSGYSQWATLLLSYEITGEGEKEHRRR